MSSSPTEPTRLENAAPLSNERTSQLDQDAGQKHHSRRTPPSRKPSSSLLSKLLAPPNELDESGGPSGRVGDSAEPVASEEGRPRTSTDNKEVGQPNGSATTNAMAATMSPPRVPPRSMGPSPVSGFSSHRELLNGRRGTSLERTHKEKMVEELPKSPFSTNPGDTGMIHPTTPTTTTPLSSISDRPPTEGVRARYRSWREPPVGAAVEKTWSIGNQGSEYAPEGQVEKSIAEALAGVEPNNRSRKASYSVRLFREGLPEEKPKKRETKDGARSKDKSPRLKEISTVNDYFGSGYGPGESSKNEFPTSPLSPRHGDRAIDTTEEKRGTLTVGTSNLWPGAFETTFTESPLDNKPDIDQQPHHLPAQLLDDLRKRHNLTPTTLRGPPLLGNLPSTVSEQAPSDENHQEPAQPTNLSVDKVDDASPLKGKSDEEDDSAEEQISSALFVPHQTSHKSHDSPDQEPSEEESPRAKKSSRRYSISEVEPEQWLVEHDVPPQPTGSSPSIVGAKSITPDARVTALPQEDSGYFPKLASSSDISSFDTHSDAGYMTQEEESSHTEDPGTTPTGTSKGERLMLAAKEKEHLHHHQQVTKAPLDAIELIPYRHQVGGHTTMWRFSKRAVCKQLNNRENEFYEKIERNHPRLLKFMPRYIGVLNVTFEKQQKRKAIVKDETVSNDGDTAKQLPVGGLDGTTSHTGSTERNGSMKSDVTPRVISQSLNPAQVPTPTVTFADNRHIIPKSFMQPHLQHLDTRLRSLSDNTEMSSSSFPMAEQSQIPPSNGDFTFRPTLSDKHAASWGATTVNKQLRNEVFGEAFLQQPIPIHRHKKPAYQHRPLTHRAVNSKGSNHLRNVNSESSLITAQQTQVDPATKPDVEESMRRKAIKGAAERHGLTPLTPFRPAQGMSHLQAGIHSSDLDADHIAEDFEETAGTSAPEADIPAESHKGKRKRRYSSGGLRRKPEAVEDARGNLKYYEEADDAGYKGDVEDDLFKMDTETSTTPQLTSSTPSSATTVRSFTFGSTAEASKFSAPPEGHINVGTMLPAARNEVEEEVPSIPRPVNPKEAQTQPDKRVEFFLLLEDLTAGMKRPCIMDLKMGTRQYGVDATESKQLSQRRKCAETTSKELGVRVCGLQVWDIATQSYIFRDKYFGRDLKAGREFQDALTRFLYDGVDYSSVLRHIPRVLHKLSQLEILIKHLHGYRFYAASLLMFYDGDVDDENVTTDASGNEKDLKPRGKEIDFKIADFANCVTAEMVSESEKPRLCPPQHPDQPDKGFLRGLRSLRKYFMDIQKEIMEREGTRVVVDKTMGDIIQNGDGSIHEEEDLGQVSY